MSAYKSYPKYKPSGVEWLGDVPEAWEVTKLKFTAAITPSNIDKKSYEDELPISLCNYTDVYYNETITRAIEFMAATATRDQIRKFSLRQHDVTITKDSEDPNDIAVPSLVAETMDSVVCGYHLTLLRPLENVDGRFLKRYFDSKTTRCYFATRANGLTRYGLGSYPLSNASIVLPPLAEQLQIAAFLDRECGKLDALQAKQERLIELLKEKRQALISHTVARGLNPTVKLKPSGIEWLGEVPEHWEVSQPRFVCRHSGGGTPSKDNPLFWNGDIPWVSPKDMKRDIIEDSIDHITMEAVSQSATNLIPVGAILMVVRGMILLHSVPVAITAAPVTVNQDMKLLICGKRLNSRFFLLLLKGLRDAVLDLVDASGHGTRCMKFNDFLRMGIPLPPLAEQRAIVAHLDEKCGKIDQLKARAERGIELLKERRSALISAAVTGKIDEREA